MKMTLIMSYRPSTGGMNSNAGALHQDENLNWRDEDNQIHKRPDVYGEDEDIYRAVKALQKNSVFRHKLKIVIDYDLYPHPNWLIKFKELFKSDDVEILKSSFKYTLKTLCIPQTRQMNAFYEAIMSIPDDEMVCYSYNSDLVCGKYWDKYIDEAYNKHRDTCVYVPIFVEPRMRDGGQCNACGEKFKEAIEGLGDLTAENIWNRWRKYCRHSLTLKPSSTRDYTIEADLDDWSRVCNEAKRGVIVEPCGERNYGYWAPIIARNKILRQGAHQLLVGYGGDLEFEKLLGMKAVVTQSHIFHFHYECKLDNIEVEHI